MPLPAGLRSLVPNVKRHHEVLLVGSVAMVARDAIRSVIPLLIRRAVSLLAAGRARQGSVHGRHHAGRGYSESGA